MTYSNTHKALKNLLAHSERVNYAFYVKGTRKAMIEVMSEQKRLLQAARKAIKEAMEEIH